MDNKNLSRLESRTVMNEILDKKATDAQVSAFLVALRMKGETVDEITGTAEAVTSKTKRIPLKYKYMVDTCGTGGANLFTFNISTTAAFVTAGAGVIVAKHGHVSVSSKCGSADLLVQLGINIKASRKKIKKCLDEIGIAFLFSQKSRGSAQYAMGPRMEIGSRTLFNILGPLTNPARTRRQIIGVYDIELMHVVVDVMRELGSERIMVVHGNDGLDEITITGPTNAVELIDGRMQEYEIRPEDYGMQSVPLAKIQTGECSANKDILLDVLAGKKGPARNIVLLNAGAAVKVSGKAETLEEGIQMAKDSIDSGAAMAKLDKIIELSN